MYEVFPVVEIRVTFTLLEYFHILLLHYYSDGDIELLTEPHLFDKFVITLQIKIFFF